MVDHSPPPQDTILFVNLSTATPGQANVLGRSSPGGGALEIDVARMRGSESVHRRHAQFDERQGQWSVSHLGRNPIVVVRPEGTVVVQPGTKLRVDQLGNFELTF